MSKLTPNEAHVSFDDVKSEAKSIIDIEVDFQLYTFVIRCKFQHAIKRGLIDHKAQLKPRVRVHIRSEIIIVRKDLHMVLKAAVSINEFILAENSITHMLYEPVTDRIRILIEAIYSPRFYATS